MSNSSKPSAGCPNCNCGIPSGPITVSINGGPPFVVSECSMLFTCGPYTTADTPIDRVGLLAFFREVERIEHDLAARRRPFPRGAGARSRLARHLAEASIDFQAQIARSRYATELVRSRERAATRARLKRLFSEAAFMAAHAADKQEK